MAGKIFYRRKLERGDASDVTVVAVQDLNLTVYQKHLYLTELRAIAEAAGAETIELPPVSRHEHELYQGEEDVEAASAI